MAEKILCLPGDGIGPEVVSETVRLLNAVGNFEVDVRWIGGVSIDAYGAPLTDETLAACRSADAVLLGAVGGPKWETDDPDAPRPEDGLLELRQGMGLFANLRPISPPPALYNASPLREERIADTNLLIVRELTGGIYYGEHNRTRYVDHTQDSAFDTCEYGWLEIARIAHVAFRLAELKVTSVDKANVLDTSRLWREVVTEVSKDYDVELDHLLVDNAAKQLISQPAEFDVILTENMFGDILSDEAAMLTGSLGMLPSASLGAEGTPGLFEPVHGSAPDIAGTGIANPLATFLSAAMMLRYGLGREAEADAVEVAVNNALIGGLRTTDLGGKATTREATDAVLQHL